MTTWNERVYPADSPKDPDYYDMMADAADHRRKQERENPCLPARPMLAPVDEDGTT